MLTDKFHTNIRKAREAAGYSQERLAEEMGIDRSTYNRFENGKGHLFAKNLARMARVLDISEEEILMGDEIHNLELLQEGRNAEEKLRAQKEFYERIIAEKNEEISRLRLIERSHQALVDAIKEKS